MEDGERTKISCGRFLLLLSQGVIMGIGAVLPGISGGVLCVIFGIYQPMMETLAHPKKGIKKYGHMVLPVVLGFRVRSYVQLRAVLEQHKEAQ